MVAPLFLAFFLLENHQHYFDGLAADSQVNDRCPLGYSFSDLLVHLKSAHRNFVRSSIHSMYLTNYYSLA